MQIYVGQHAPYSIIGLGSGQRLACEIWSRSLIDHFIPHSLFPAEGSASQFDIRSVMHDSRRCMVEGIHFDCWIRSRCKYNSIKTPRKGSSPFTGHTKSSPSDLPKARHVRRREKDHVSITATTSRTDNQSPDVPILDLA